MSETPDEDGVEQGGDPACWLHLVCPACGRIADGPATVCPNCGEPLPADGE